jgi:hypothetical protein
MRVAEKKNESTPPSHTINTSFLLTDKTQKTTDTGKQAGKTRLFSLLRGYPSSLFSHTTFSIFVTRRFPSGKETR